MRSIRTIQGGGSKGRGEHMDVKAVRPDRAFAAVVRAPERTWRYLQAAQTMLIGLDSAHRVTLINSKGCQVLGCEERDVLEQNWFERAAAPEHRGRGS